MIPGSNADLSSLTKSQRRRTEVILSRVAQRAALVSRKLPLAYSGVRQCRDVEGVTSRAHTRVICCAVRAVVEAVSMPKDPADTGLKFRCGDLSSGTNALWFCLLGTNLATTETPRCRWDTLSYKRSEETRCLQHFCQVTGLEQRNHLAWGRSRRASGQRVPSPSLRNPTAPRATCYVWT